MIELAQSPALAVSQERGWLILFDRPGQGAIFAARSADGANFAEDEQAAIVPRPEDAEAFDTERVLKPSLSLTRTDAGREHYALWFNGIYLASSEERLAVGYAASFDGLTWQRFFGNQAVLDATLPDESGPAGLALAARSFLFFAEERNGRQRITAAIHP